MTIEIGDFPINSMVIFHSYVNVYQRVLFYLIYWVDFFPYIVRFYHEWVNSSGLFGFVEIFAASPIFKRCEEYKIGKYLLPGMFDLIQKRWPCLSRKKILYVMICGVWRCQPCVSWYQPINHPLFWNFLDNFLEYLNVVGIFGSFSRIFAIFGPTFDKLSCGFQHTHTHIPYGSLRS